MEKQYQMDDGSMLTPIFFILFYDFSLNDSTAGEFTVFLLNNNTVLVAFFFLNYYYLTTHG